MDFPYHLQQSRKITPGCAGHFVLVGRAFVYHLSHSFQPRPWLHTCGRHYFHSRHLSARSGQSRKHPLRNIHHAQIWYLAKENIEMLEFTCDAKNIVKLNNL